MSDAPARPDLATAPLHVDHAYAAQTEFGRPLVNLGWDEVLLPHPVLTVAPEGYNQDGVVVCSFQRTLLVYRRGHGPARRREPTETT